VSASARAIFTILFIALAALVQENQFIGNRSDICAFHPRSRPTRRRWRGGSAPDAADRPLTK
jgi:hypothetical protein